MGETGIAIRFPGWSGVFLFFILSSPAQGSRQLFIGCLLRAVSPRTKWAGRESDRSPPSKVKVKDAWSRNSLFPYAFIAWPATTLSYSHVIIKLNNFGSFS